jgi:hypothetical protein
MEWTIQLPRPAGVVLSNFLKGCTKLCFFRIIPRILALYCTWFGVFAGWDHSRKPGSGLISGSFGENGTRSSARPNNMPSPNNTGRLVRPVDFRMSRYPLSCSAPTCVIEEHAIGMIHLMDLMATCSAFSSLT